MSSKILIKRSTTTGAIPTTADLDTGEFAVNTVDKRIFTNNQGTIVELGTNPTAVNTGSVTTTSGTAGSWTVTGTLTVSTPSNATDAASKGYVDAQIASVIDSAPDALNTLNELAQALNDDANFANNVLLKAGGTMTGNLNMGSNKVTTTANPTTDDDLARKGYVDTILGSATDAATSASEAATSATNAATSEANAATSASNAATSASNASTSATSASSSASSASTSATSASTSATQAQTSATQAAQSASDAEDSYDSFTQKYVVSATAPASPVEGQLWWDSTNDAMKVYDGNSFVLAGSAVNGTAVREVFTATAGQTTFTIAYDVGFVDVFLNGVKLVATTDFTATNGTSVVLTQPAALDDIVDIIAYGAFEVSNTYTQAQADNKFEQITNLGTAAYTASTDYATAAQGATADTALQPESAVKSGGGVLTYGILNILTDTNTYTLPLANSVDSGDYIEIELPDTYKTFTPTVARAGSDNIRYSEGTDTSIVFNSGSSVSLRLVSNGTNEWSF